MSDSLISQSPSSGPSTEKNPWPLSRLSASLKDYIERLGSVWVEGQLAQLNLKPTSFFAELRDLVEEKHISISSFDPVVAKEVAKLSQGDRVVVNGKFAYWEKSGKLQFSVYSIRKVGLGELLERIQRLRETLTAEGLTSAARKKPLPFLPNVVGLITGANTDAEKDVKTNAEKRWPMVVFRVIHTKVQGEAAAPEIIAALKTLDADPEVDVIIVARGGGSFQDLLVFSDEALVRQAAACETPIISAIGHENDNPVLDDVADFRASTPTDAAKHVVPDAAEERRKLSQALGQMMSKVNALVSNQMELIASYRSRPILASPHTFLETFQTENEQRRSDIRGKISNLIDREQLVLTHLRQQVKSLSPQSTLDRGYAVVRNERGQVLSDASKVPQGTKLKLKLAKGELGATAD